MRQQLGSCTLNPRRASHWCVVFCLRSSSDPHRSWGGVPQAVKVGVTGPSLNCHWSSGAPHSVEWTSGPWVPMRGRGSQIDDQGPALVSTEALTKERPSHPSPWSPAARERQLDWTRGFGEILTQRFAGLTLLITAGQRCEDFQFSF